MKLLLAGCLFLCGLGCLQLTHPTPSAPPAPAVAAATWQGRPLLKTDGRHSSVPAGYSPAQLRRAYGFDHLPADGQGSLISVVDAYDDPLTAADLEHFVATFKVPGLYGLPHSAPCTVAAGPHPCFQRLSLAGTEKGNAGWALETALDTQWAHALAPGADLLLVETRSASLPNLLKGVDAAVAAHAQAISLSWGGPEFASEQAEGKHFPTSAVFAAASGDNGHGTSFPAVLPSVLAVGGTTLRLDRQGNALGAETAWNGSGGGLSPYLDRPAFQRQEVAGARRSMPDLSFNADPATGYSVYSSLGSPQGNGWSVVGGTSAAAPAWAAVVALANQGRTQPLSGNAAFYAASRQGNFRDIVQGSNGSCATVCAARFGYDQVTGLGTPLVSRLVPWLRTH